jgi:hypothetical protein
LYTVYGCRYCTKQKHAAELLQCHLDSIQASRNKQKKFLIHYSLQLLGVTIIPKKVTDFLRSTIYESVLTREKEDIVRPDMLQLLTQAMKGTLTDETYSEDTNKTDKSNGTWLFLCWDQNTNRLRVIHDKKKIFMRKN